MCLNPIALRMTKTTLSAIRLTGPNPKEGFFMNMAHCIPSIMSGTVNPTGHNELSHSKCSRVDKKTNCLLSFPQHKWKLTLKDYMKV